MTNNQISYWNLIESQRHNAATEGIDTSKVGETVRHNKTSEELGYGNLDYNYANLAETKRYNDVKATQGNTELFLKGVGTGTKVNLVNAIPAAALGAATLAMLPSITGQQTQAESWWNTLSQYNSSAGTKTPILYSQSSYPTGGYGSKIPKSAFAGSNATLKAKLK